MQGSYKFFCLTTGQLLVRRRFTPMPGIPTTIINAVLKFADKEDRPTGITFRNRNNESFNFSNDDIDDILLTRQIEVAPFPDIPNELPGPEHVTPVTPDPQPPQPNRDDIAAQAAHNAGLDLHVIADPGVPIVHHYNANQNINNGQITDDETEDFYSDPDDDSIEPAQSIHSTSSHPSTSSTDSDSDDDTPPPAPAATTSTGRTRKQPTYLNDYHVYAQTIDDSNLQHIDDDTLAHVCIYIMVQHANKLSTKNSTPKTTFSLNTGLKKFGERGEAAVTKELSQFNVLNAFVPLDAKTLTYEQRKSALASLIFLTEKHDGTVKARACANGAPQREHMAKEEVTSPTVSTDATFMLAAIAAHEHWATATLDLPGAFLHADNDSFVIMKMTGRLAELMVATAPSLYRKYVIDDSSGKPILYVQLQKALYGMLKSALLFYRKLVMDLTAMGFELNPYDPCVANKMVDGKQLTVSWHVDDLTVSHANESAIVAVIDKLKSIYGTNLKETIGPIQDYLGMKFDYTVPGQVEISMDKYISNVIDTFPEQITDTSATPATDKLFLIRADDRPLPEEQALHFHHVTAQLLYASIRVRRDIQTTVAFLTTRVKSPGEDDWGKLKRVLKYLNGTRNLHLTLSVDSLSSIKWYIDGSHQIHDDCRGHTGSIMTLGQGAIASTSRKQKINTKSLTETELVAVHDKLGDVLWTRYFLESQGYSIKENIIYQDNMSTLSLEKNGRVSGSSRTKHIKAKYYLVQDKYNSNEIDLKYCPTDIMWADVLTKPLQGLKFRQMCAVLMNCPLDYTDN